MKNITTNIKVLWVVNVPPANFPGIKKSIFGGWMQKQYETLTSQNCTVFCFFPGSVESSGEEFYQYKLNRIYNSQSYILNLIKKLIQNFKPDIMHIHGTEMLHSFCAARAACEMGIPYVVSLQGIVSEILKHSTTGLGCSQINGMSFRDLILRSSVAQVQNKWKKSKNNELFIVRNSDMVFGRTNWDHSWVKFYCPNVEYAILTEPLREAFLESEKWDYNRCKKNSLLILQASTSIKGMHILIEAINLLRNIDEYSDIELLIAGKNFYAKGFRDKLKLTYYEKYILNLIKKYKLDKSVVFVGNLNEFEVASIMLKSNIFVLPSMIENSPNSLMEASYLGLPAVASYVGGIPSLFGSSDNIILYQSDSFLMCAAAIRDALRKTIMCAKDKSSDFFSNPTKYVESIDLSCRRPEEGLVDYYWSVIK